MVHRPRPPSCKSSNAGLGRTSRLRDLFVFVFPAVLDLLGVAAFKSNPVVKDLRIDGPLPRVHW